MFANGVHPPITPESSKVWAFFIICFKGYFAYKYRNISNQMDSKLYAEAGALAKKWKGQNNRYDPNDPDNKKRLVEGNMKLAIGVALKYRGMGLSEDELISAALLGLVTAVEKYNPQKVVLRDTLLGLVKDDTTPDEFLQILSENMPYNTESLQNFNGVLPETPSEMRAWINKNIKPAKFSSVAQFWIRAMILNDLNKYKNPVCVGENDRGSVFFDNIEEDTLYFANKITHKESDWEDKEVAWNKLMDGVPEECQRVLEMRYGIGCDEPQTLKEIANVMNRDVRWTKRCLEDVMDAIQYNAIKYKLNIGDFLG